MLLLELPINIHVARAEFDLVNDLKVTKVFKTDLLEGKQLIVTCHCLAR